MTMLKKILLILLLLTPIALADLSDYPAPFVVDHNTKGLATVMGANYVGKHSVVATEIVYALRPINGNYITRLDTEMLDTYQNYDLFLIGNPCQNIIVSKVLNTNDCEMGLKPGEAIIKLVDNGAHKAIIVAGYDFESLRGAGLVLANHNKYNFLGNEYRLESENTETPSETPASEPTKFTGKCDGCAVAQSCLKKGEKVFGTYCDGSQMQEFKANGLACKENYECLSELCKEDKCGSKSLWQTIVEWLKKIF